MKETLILLPGLGSTEVNWQHQVQHLEDQLNVQVTVMDQALSRSELVNAFLEQAPEQFYLAGHSYGGWLAQVIAATAPERVLKLMLLNTLSRNNPEHIGLLEIFKANIKKNLLSESLDANLENIIFRDRLEDQELVEPLQNMLKGFSPDSYLNQVQAMIDDYPTEALLSKISCPTLVVDGRQDDLFPPGELAFIAEQIPEARLTVIEECGHMSPMERPHAVTALMRLWFGTQTI
ncbi:2-hydroxymuconate semialdehyde hydrolase [Gimesia fumaroli]|uniref:2-hydroxymuconate semialdehyde hydrolase n=2 Tax=Gimesia fumaroli TaxID=2527976 RepID=A0A518ILK9_9PLAN|nr:2-hydroxymuconate semialdehyde hydrolase [Gimesia fumaroli]